MASVSHLYNIRGEEQLSDKEKNALQAMTENYKEGDLLKVYTFPNFSTDGEDVPKGTVFVHPKNATVHPDSIPEQMLVIQAISKLERRKNAPNGYTSADFQGKNVQNALNDAIPQFTHYNGPTLYPEPEHINEETGLQKWAAEMGDEGSQVGVMETTGARGRGKDYYLVARAGANKACRELKNYINENRMTYEQLVRDPMFVKARNMARSNCLRLMRNAAAAIGVPLTRINDDLVDTSPERAEPEYEQSVSTIKRIPFKGQEAVAIFNGVTPMDEVNSAIDGLFFIQAHPYEGMYVYPMYGQGKGIGLPTDTGATTTTTTQSDALEGPGEQQGFLWENQEQLESHPDLFKGAHREMDDQMEDALVEAGYQRRNRRKHLVPVLMKLCNPTLKK